MALLSPPDSWTLRDFIVMFIIGVIFFAAGASGLTTAQNCPNTVNLGNTRIYMGSMIALGVVIMIWALVWASNSAHTKGLRECLQSQIR